MEIRKRSSGGRGEYEIAGTYGGIKPDDLLDKHLVLDYSPIAKRISTGITLKEQGGKKRLRRFKDVNSGIQIHRIVEASLLLPKSIRDERLLVGGYPVFAEGRYMLEKIGLGKVSIQGSDSVVRIYNLEGSNPSTQGEEIGFTERLERLSFIYSKANEFVPELQLLVQRHRELLQSTDILSREIEKLCADIRMVVETYASDYSINYDKAEDPLSALERMLRKPSERKPHEDIELIPSEEVALRRRVIEDYRKWAISRGTESAKFRRAVRKNYHSTCLVCGIYLPNNEFCKQPGVDAAHILPWAQYELDHPSNGICLCKLHHWAFDQFLISIGSDDDGNYLIRLTKTAYEAFGNDEPRLIAELESHAGMIPRSRLPRKRQDRPNGDFLDKLNEESKIQTDN